MDQLLILFFILALLAEIVGTLSGFGSSVLFVPIAAYFFDFHTVLGITALFHIFSNITKIYFFREGINWRIVLLMGIPAVIAVSIGAVFSKWFETQILQSILAVFLILFSIVFLIYRNLELKPTKLNSLLGGGASGFIAGLVGTGGAIRGMVLSAFNLEKAVFISTSAFIDFGVDLSRGVVYVLNGFVSLEILPIVAGLLLVSVAGTYIGKKILEHVSEAMFKNLVLFMILGVGVITLVKVVFFV